VTQLVEPSLRHTAFLKVAYPCWTIVSVVCIWGRANSVEHPDVTFATSLLSPLLEHAGCAHMPLTQALIGFTTESAVLPAPTKMGRRRFGARQPEISGSFPMLINVFMHPIENEFADTKPARAMIVVRRNIIVGKFERTTGGTVQRCRAAGVEPASEIAVSQESPCSVRFR